MTTASQTLTTVSRPSEDALIGIDRALSFYATRLTELGETKVESDLADCLRAAQSWLMTIQSEIHADDVANDR